MIRATLVLCVASHLMHGILFAATPKKPAAADVETSYNVVIAGGSTAAFAAAVAAAQNGAHVALIEPTDWIGGQLTSSAVPAVDEAWHKLTDANGNVTMNVAAVARTPANMSPLLRDMLLQTGNPGRGWVSRFCFLPEPFLRSHLQPLQAEFAGRLTVFHETVVKSATYHGDRVTGLRCIQRLARNGVGGAYRRLPSASLGDWYSVSDSEDFTKRQIQFSAAADASSIVFIDATEWGELLVLADAPYLQGVEHQDGGLAGDPTLGQAITYGFAQQLHAQPDARRDAGLPKPNARRLGWGDYRKYDDAWHRVWTYRRLLSSRKATSVGDISLQNWGYYHELDEGGNDYPDGYLLLTPDQAKTERKDWRGGVDLRVLAAAEARAYAWHHWLKQRTPPEFSPEQVSLARAVFGASHGLSKLPYIRDTRRSIGIDDFLLTVTDLAPTEPGKTARVFPDRVALGAYPVDIHRLAHREYPEYIEHEYQVAPFTVPLRALTNRKYGNMLVAGKTMAQSFLANSATRLHPTEWSSGIAAGTAAAMMADRGWSSRQLLDNINTVQAAVRRMTPIDWTLPP